VAQAIVGRASQRGAAPLTHDELRSSRATTPATAAASSPRTTNGDAPGLSLSWNSWRSVCWGRLGVNLGASRVVPRLSGSLTMHVVDRKVIVVGGGVSGLCVAYYMRRAGAAVRVLETRRVGSGASSGNAGWVTPAQAGPLPEPGLVGYGVRSLFEPRAPLYVEPRQLVRMLPWLLGFARRCNEADHREGRLALGTLGQRSLGLLEGMTADGVDFELHRVPLLAAAIDARQAHTFLSRLEPLSRLGFRIPSEVLGQEDLRSLEPTLTDVARAGFVIEQHSVVEPQALLAALTRRLKELEVEIGEGSEVRDADLDGPRVVALRSSTGRYRCDQVVLAAGAWLGPLARMFGTRLPIQAGKGYSFEIRPRSMPRHALLLLDPHVGCSPLGDRLRVAGTMEFSGLNTRLDRRRIQSIAQGASRLIDGWADPDEDTLWCGLRPIAPDGLPIIDRHPKIANVFFAGAYSMLGMTLAAPAAEKLAQFMVTDHRPPELAPFRVDRFRRVKTNMPSQPRHDTSRGADRWPGSRRGS
jgi:D-amino-acid dehydrogenase